MVTGVEAHKLAASASRGGGPSYQDFSGGGGAHSASTSGSEPAATAPASDGTFPRLDVHGDDAGFPHGAVSGKKKKRGARAVGADKSGRGLRQFSMKVCEKVESKGRTTYNEVADKLVAEFADPSTNLETPDQQQYDEKNIRRRVYDALNVLMAMDIIAKDKKEIQWKGLPRMNLNDIEELKAEHIALRSRIDKKRAYLQELEDQVLKSWYSGTSSCMDQEMHLQVEWHCLLFLFRLNHMLLLRLKYQRICSWSISTLIALLSSCMMTPMFSRQ